MMAVDVSTVPDVMLSPPRLLFEQSYAFGGGITIANYDVTRDGQRFIMVKDESTAARLNVVLTLVHRSQSLGSCRRALTCSATSLVRLKPDTTHTPLNLIPA